MVCNFRYAAQCVCLHIHMDWTDDDLSGNERVGEWEAGCLADWLQGIVGSPPPHLLFLELAVTV